jgi:hypothetical protein
MYFFSIAVFLSSFSFAAYNFCRILNYILIGLYVPMPVVKNQRGSRETFLSYSAVKVSSSHIPEIAAPPLQVISGPMDELRRAVAHLFFNGIYLYCLAFLSFFGFCVNKF